MGGAIAAEVATGAEVKGFGGQQILRQHQHQGDQHTSEEVEEHEPTEHREITGGLGTVDA